MRSLKDKKKKKLLCGMIFTWKDFKRINLTARQGSVLIHVLLPIENADLMIVLLNIGHK
jgi:hypothetical protein